MYSRKLIILFLFITSVAFARKASGPYNTGIGLRGGFLYGVTVKHFIKSNSVLDFIAGTRWQGFSFTALYEFQKETGLTSGLDWYFGFGAHVGFYENRYYFADKSVFTGDRTTAVGVDGIIGLEYKIGSAPITLGIDFKPFFDFTSGRAFADNIDAGLTARYVF